MEGIDKVQILNDEVKILKNEIKDILVEIKEMLITLPQNISASYSLDETGGPKSERSLPTYNQHSQDPSFIDAPHQPQISFQTSAQMPQQQMQMPQQQMPQGESFRYGGAINDISSKVEQLDREFHEKRERKPGDREAVSSDKQWIDEEEMQVKENQDRDRDRKEARLHEDSEERGKGKKQQDSGEIERAPAKEKKKEMLKKEIETEEKTESGIPSASGDVDIVTLATFSRWLNSGMSRLGKERMHEIIEVSASMGGISPTMKDILLRLLQMDNGQGYVVKESLAVLIDLDNILMRNKKNREESAVLSLFINNADEVHG